MPMRERSMKRWPSKPSFKTEKRRLDAIRPDSNASSCWSETTQFSAFSLEKAELISRSRKHFTPNVLLPGASRYLESPRTRVQGLRKPRRSSFQATPEASARSREIDAGLEASAAGMEQNPTILVLGDCDATRQIMTALRRSPQCVPDPRS